MCKVVRVSFAGNQEVLYDFFTDLDLQVGDPVVCDTSRGYSVGKVVMSVAPSKSKATKWVVQRVDVEGHKKRLERIKKLKEKRLERIKELEEMLE